ncbi:MAG TPA: tetratricopeptide repeat protein [Myxococcaceae bacterium]|nr:tetratricopeptide repeat protein [Myxococcaceae bacterium]
MALEWARTLHGYADDPAAALQQVDRAVVLAPGLHGARFERALLHLKLGRPQEALDGLDALLATGMRHPELLHVHRARAYEGMAAFSDALGAWQMAIRSARPSAWLHWQHARVAWRMGRLRDAAEALNQAASVAAEDKEAPDPELLLDLAEVEWALGATARARRALEQAAAALWPEEVELLARHDLLEARLAAPEP